MGLPAGKVDIGESNEDAIVREVLEIALQNYEGAILLVSHDRYFVDEIFMEKTIVLEDGKSFEKLL